MSNNSSKTITVVVVILVIIVAIALIARKHPAAAPATDLGGSSSAVTAPTADTTASAPATDPSTAAIQNSGSSDASLSQDAASIDAQMNGLNSDNTAAAQQQ